MSRKGTSASLQIESSPPATKCYNDRNDLHNAKGVSFAKTHTRFLLRYRGMAWASNIAT